ncbi:hypothetical protein AXF42_Ash021161 [Apostasia shenzhenica]|uniref:HNH nuclease domain-containing protein n=1 Tax=Apostasia shenzhenica TaxID=1088818 RepID=A0A2I0A5I8_9ASPA|nr:hypothetical protein AXF42_Ash021161 [Apostasia shenzhenica]
MRPRKPATGSKSSDAASSSQQWSSFDTSSMGLTHDRASALGTAAKDRTRNLAEEGVELSIDELIDDHISYPGGSGGVVGSGNPRTFPYGVKQQCWEKADVLKGRDPDRWRRDSLGNIVFRKLVGCPGCLCHDYDHIIPYSKGGKSTLENCQVLQAAVNRSKGNKTDISKSYLIQKSAYCRISGRDMDLLELSAYGNIRRAHDSGGCNIQ